MSHQFPTAGLGSGLPADALWQVLDQLRNGFDKRAPSTRAGRGDVRAAVLALLNEQPMHGYQIIREIEQRSGGSWKPSAGSVYPTLQLLVDEGLLSAEEANGRKTYALTEAGRDVAADAEVPWTEANEEAAAPRGVLPKSAIELAQAAAQVGRSGTPEQQGEAAVVLDEARRRLYAILAQD